jgi:hypothetical protein
MASSSASALRTFHSLRARGGGSGGFNRAGLTILDAGLSRACPARLPRRAGREAGAASCPDPAHLLAFLLE